MRKPEDIDFKKINFILLDMDGVLTDGSIIYTDGGEQIKIFSVYDGYAFERAHKAGYKFGIITGKQTPVNNFRARRLKVEELYENCFDKVAAYEEIKKKYKLSDESFMFMGDDVFDLPLLRKVGFSCAPANAMEEVKTEVDFVTQKEGGKGAVREVIDMIMRKSGKN